MDNQSSLFNTLQMLNEFNNFSLGLHSTKDKETAKLILQNGLNIRCGVCESTVKFRGSMNDVSKNDIDYFFPGNNYTVVIAIPSFLKADRITDNLGGDTCLCEFSKFVKATSLLKNIFPEFYNKNNKSLYETIIPSELIVGYYDKDYKFIENPKCRVFEKHVDGKKTYLEDLEERIKNNKSSLDLLISLSGYEGLSLE